MKRYALIPSLLVSGPALAHAASDVHIHHSDTLSMIMGLVLISLGVGAALFIRIRAK